ncbi:MAG: argininosuccinate lyase [Candidatus Micrarchaeia archaeon]
MKPLWGGRFSEKPADLLLRFASAENIQVDAALVPYDIRGSIAHALMLAKTGILEKGEARAIVSALRQALSEFEKGSFVLRLEDEDVHLNVERLLTAKIGDVGKKLHTARSRNDQVNLDMRLYLRDKANELESELLSAAKAFLELAKTTMGIILPGYTHTRVAQPITAAFWAHAHAEALLRCAHRVQDAYARLNSNPLGACALAGTSWPIDRNYTAQLLGFEDVQQNALDVVTSRGEGEAELASVCALAMTRLSIIATDLILYSSPELGFADLPEEYCTGSSIMPQKKNPDALELVRGRAARVAGNLSSLLAIQKGLPSGHNADTQETKRLAMDSLATTLACLRITAEIVRKLEFDSEKAVAACEKSYAAATDLADLLARKGIPFRIAHEIVGSLLKECAKENCMLSHFTPAEVNRVIQKVFHKRITVSEAELAAALDIQEGARARKNGPAPENVRRMIAESEKKLSALQASLNARLAALKKADELLAREASALR